MAGVICRLLPTAGADGPANMAADEVLLEAAGAGVLSLRFYTWSVPTLSLGYFQPAEARRQTGRLAALPYVRRPSGGATLVHHFELTYALAIPANLVGSSAAAWLRRVHGVIAAALTELGVAVHLCAGASQPVGPATVLCFRQWTPGDLVVGGAKVVGSAQRRHRGALLQHGAILLAQSPHTPELPGIRDLAGIPFAFPELTQTICKELAKKTGWLLEPNDWTPREYHRREEVRLNKYLQEDWNHKR